MRTRIQDGIAWFDAAQEASGHFSYEYQPYDNEYLYGDNTTRQAGVLYVLGEVARRDPAGTHSFDTTMAHAIHFFQNITVSETRGDYNFKCVAEHKGSSVCIVGATSLVLVGLLSYLKAHPEETDRYKALIDSYADYILAMKESGIGFRNVYRTNQDTQDDAEDQFSNGEALLALARYYSFNPRPEVREVIDETFAYLSNTPFNAPLYLWMMAALKEMYALWHDESYITYARDYTHWTVNRIDRFKGTDQNYCAVTEGVVSGYSLLETSLPEGERAALKSKIDFWNKKNSHFQIGPDDEYRVIIDKRGAQLKHLEDSERANGGFLTGERTPTERIDFTQHCVSTFVQTLVDIERGTL